MLEKNKEQFPGFAGDGIKSKIHEFEGAHYYSVPPKYVFSPISILGIIG